MCDQNVHNPSLALCLFWRVVFSLKLYQKRAVNGIVLMIKSTPKIITRLAYFQPDFGSSMTVRERKTSYATRITRFPSIPD